ncbi:MAG TPA: hypothetical protein VHC92_14010 [Rhodanobacteraceae bacterium]|jgi:hypothetical protein|nr:hypothetical protein [Rhodanobacteraceae bacterium]
MAAATRRTHWIGIATALMTALAGGAVWCLIALYARRDLIALALPIAGLIVWALRAHGYAGRWSGAAVAAICVALASAYSLYLQASAQVASVLGLPLREALLQIGPRMAFDIMRANLDAVGAATLLAAVLVGAIGTAWSTRGS